jgi:hypothetical protein
VEQCTSWHQPAEQRSNNRLASQLTIPSQQVKREPSTGRCTQFLPRSSEKLLASMTRQTPTWVASERQLLTTRDKRASSQGDRLACSAPVQSGGSALFVVVRRLCRALACWLEMCCRVVHPACYLTVSYTTYTYWSANWSANKDPGEAMAGSGSAFRTGSSQVTCSILNNKSGTVATSPPPVSSNFFVVDLPLVDLQVIPNGKLHLERF